MMRQRLRATGQPAPLSAWEPHLSCRLYQPTTRLHGAGRPHHHSANRTPRLEQQLSLPISSARGLLQVLALRLRRARHHLYPLRRRVFPFPPRLPPLRRLAVTSLTPFTHPIKPATHQATSLPLLLHARLPSPATFPLLPLFQPRQTLPPRSPFTLHHHLHHRLGRTWTAARRRVDYQIYPSRRRFPRRSPHFLLRPLSPRHQLFDWIACIAAALCQAAYP